MNLEKTEIWITAEKLLELSDGRAIRGFWGNLFKNRPEFHGRRWSELKIGPRFVKQDKDGYRPFQRETLEAIKNLYVRLIFVEAPFGSGKNHH